MRKSLVLLLILAFCTSCSEVKAWQKGNLAKSHMAFETDPVESKFMQHTYTSKEGSTGGYGTAGGGCGCN